MTLDQFYARIEDLLRRFPNSSSSPAWRAMLKERDATKEGRLTPDLVRELANSIL